MVPLHSSKEYLFNLYTTSSGEARRLWRKQIKESWNHQCAYCGSEENLTIDHVVPQSKGGSDFTKNVVCCCHSCNQDKSHTPWEDWFSEQDFFTEEKRRAILKWMHNKKEQVLYKYPQRQNKV
jgi:CRISPR/Cas system Type II protein with McrA/HNH and RuvC-like nuclease domain